MSVRRDLVSAWLHDNERSQRWLARKAGVSITAIQNLLAGKEPKLSTIHRVSRVTNIPLDSLVTDEKASA